MIELDRTDEEREELVKQWIRDYWLFAAVVIVLAIGLVYGLDYYRRSQTQALSNTAEQTEQITKLLSEKQIDAAKAAVSDLQNTQTETSFSALATLRLAKALFEAGNYAEAVTQYDWLITHAADVAMRDVARLRKARAAANAKQYDNAINTLNSLENQDTALEAGLLKGDIYMASQQYEQAKKTYESLKEQEGLNLQVVDSRLNLLTIKQQKQP